MRTGWLQPEPADGYRLDQNRAVWVGELPARVRVLSAWIDLRPGKYSDAEYDKYLGPGFSKPNGEEQTTNGVFCLDSVGRTISAVPANVTFTLGCVARPNHTDGYLPLVQYQVAASGDQDRLFHWRAQLVPHQRLLGYTRDVVLYITCPDDIRLVGQVEWGLHVEDQSQAFVV